MPFLFSLIILAASLCGLIISFYIYRHKTTGSPLICPLEADCEAVVKSEYATTLGFPNEVLGLVYYGVFFLIYFVFLFQPALFLISWLAVILALISFSSFAFGVYLLYVQIVKLKEWCSWCIFASLCSTIIFLATTGVLFYK